VLTDIVGAYTLDQIFPGGAMANPDPDRRVIRQIEQKVNERFDPSWAGIWYKGLDILSVKKPADIEAQAVKKWAVPIERELLLEKAKAERDALIERSRGQARALYNLESIKAKAREDMVGTVEKLFTTLTKSGRDQIAWRFVGVIEELTKRVGEDETVTMRYIEAMEAMVESPGPKSFVVAPPERTPGALPSPPAPTAQEFKMIDGRESEE
jgi:hypothetical protein